MVVKSGSQNGSSPEPATNEASESPGAKPHDKAVFMSLVVGSIGVVYGDIGTSPLYAFREAARYVAHEAAIQPLEIYGILSLIIWSLILIVTLKYVLFLLRMDNRGEGGILSLMTLTHRPAGKYSRVVFLIGLIGAGLFYGDATITPAISVLSAVEGLKVITPGFDKIVLPLAVVILVTLFTMQKYGTEKVSKFFGPVTVIWFLCLALTGLYWIFQNPSVLFAFNPYYGVYFLLTHQWVSFVVLGFVLLSITGAEALYADLGHFGRKPIQVAWLYFVFPCLVLNYLGQGALVLSHPEAVDNSFFLLVPEWLLPGLVAIATMATIIASQAVITGAYSLSRQAIQLGLLPRMEIRHTSADQHGQIYMPLINKWLLYVVVLLCLIFGSSENLASAYGIAVTGTMICSTLLAFVVVWRLKKKTLLFSLAVIFPLLFVELTFFASTAVKIFEGGFIPLFLAAFTVTVMLVWVRGTNFLHRRARRQAMPLCDLIEELERTPPAIVPGTAVFMSSDPTAVPIALTQNLKHNKVLHEKNIVLCVISSQFPKVPEAQRIVVEPLSSHVTRVFVHFGFMEIPDIPKVLLMAKARGLNIDINAVSYFLGRRSVVGHPNHGLPAWQEKVYISMLKSSTAATDFYKLPADKVVELGVQMPI